MLKSVLIVDDSKVIREVVHDFIASQTNWQVAGEAENGREAIEKALQSKPDLILMDFLMPVMNGLEAAMTLKKILPNVHIVLFTMFGEALGGSVPFASGVDLVVSKAEGLTHLVEAIERLESHGPN